MDSHHKEIGVTLTRHVDRISTLPDDIITNSILTLLPTRDSVRTSALSTRWKHLYASVPIIKFTEKPNNINQRDPTVFAGIVSNVLNTVTNKLPRISDLYIYLDEIRVSSSDIISWIETATSHSVQKLDVYGFWVECAPTPHCLFTCETLVSLSLDLQFILSVPDKVCLPKLKNLWLKNLVFGGDESDDESVRRLFSSCPVLEKLMVFSTSTPPNARVFSVSIPSLKELGLYLEHPRIELSINCPNLEKLSCDCYATRGYSGDVLGSLKECEIEAGLYEDGQFGQGKLIELVRQVCKVQSLSLAGDSMRFYISLDHISVRSSDIVSWIETATSHYVEILEVYGFWIECATLPHCLFTCDTLVSLSLDLRFLFSVPDKVCLPKLKNLWLKNLVFGDDESDDESVRRLFSSCPVLEKLMVFSTSTPSNATVFSVSSASLKDLYLDLGHPRFELSINCPNLEELECNSYAVRGYSGDVLRSLKKCQIDVGLYGDQQFEQGKLIELVKQVCKVQLLSLAGTSMQNLLVHTGSLPNFENLTNLELESDTIIGWRLLPSILDSTPRLETLDLAKGFFDIDNYFGHPYSPPEHVPTCLSFHLKVIKIGRFVGEEEEYKWVEYFLTNALVLEKMEIRLWSSEDFEEENDPVVEGEGEGEGEGNVEVEVEGEGEVEVEGEGNGEIEGEIEVEGEGEGAGNGEVEGEEQDEEEDQEVGGSEFEQHFEISRRLLSYQRSSEVCQIVLLPPDY